MPKKRDISPEELQARGVPMPRGKTAAKMAARDTMTSLSNKEMVQEMARRRTASIGGPNIRTASTAMALPKLREPLQTLKDKGIPTNTADPEELKKIRHWSRLFYATHDLIPLLIDIYSRFPVIGMDFTSGDTKITQFYSDMFLNQLNYEKFLPALGREHFTVGETNTLGHFHDVLGIWSKEEILNPDSIHVTQSMFDSDERVQLLVKDMVEALRDPQGGNLDATEGDIRRRQEEYRMLEENYPEMIEAAARGDGLDISNILLSRTVNKVSPGDLRGTPHLMRSFRTLMMEESLNAAQDAVADRLYSPLILATLGIPNLGDGEPWIPTPEELDETRDLMDQALAADFRLMVHNFGLQITSVFGRESVPRFDQDYARIDKKLMQAWGIGEALISGGGSSTYASSALNREFVTQMMLSWQSSVRHHMIGRMEVIAEAQEHYDYEMKGGLRKPIFREVVEVDEETGMEYTRKVPKLLIPDVRFQCVVPGTQVLTPTGQRNVEDIQVGDEVVAWDGEGYVLDTALHTGVEHRDHLVEVTTATGRTVRCTADHPFWTNEGWVKAEGILGHSIRTSAGQMSASELETEDDLDLLYFIGLLVGDGNYSTTHVSLSVSDPSIDEFACGIAEQFGLVARKKVDSRTENVWGRVFARTSPWKGSGLRNPLHTLLREEGMWGSTGHTKRVPPMVWAAGSEGRAAFLSGYFDADGHARRDSGFKMSSVNRRLLDDCQVLFESLGIRSQVRTYEYPRAEDMGGGERTVNILTVSNSHYYSMLNKALSPKIESKRAALVDMDRATTRGRREALSAEWDRAISVEEIGSGDIVTLGIAETHTHVTAGLVSHNTLNLRDEVQERGFLQTLKNAGVPISDQTLAVNIPIDFEEETERRSAERIQKFISESQVMKKAYEELKAKNHPIPPELMSFMAAQKADAAIGGPPSGAPGEGEEGEGEEELDTPIGDSTSAEQNERALEIDTVGTETGAGETNATPLVPKNRSRPEESDEQRGSSPKAAHRMAKNPSSFGSSKRATYKQVNSALKRMEAEVTLVSDLVETDKFFEAINREAEAAYVRKHVDEVQMSLESLAGGVRLGSMASPTAQEAFDVIEGMLDQYELAYDFRPDW